MLTVIKVLLVLIVIYLLFNQLTKGFINEDYKKSIDSLNTNIINLEKKQDSLNLKINDFNQEISDIDKNITNIQNQKTIIKEFYHEKIISVDTFSLNDIDRFFTERYHLTK